ncbi:hypothetical protein LB543_31200 [Mesorhizobium sp. ESP7-2]|uniref:hypothetical protein n=1 Tax=Mesorhizobium sp. ESP7-2 TaxID=2876622 RepID=UPI001CCB1C39|nr:hypothetical protein [Mesorhizobium sp. ESP7-2]MBZ9711166.1 hypothetical protein [Mesorhizobium sp. ESP7-2]
MINEQDSLYSLIELMKQKAPAYFKLLAAKSENEFDEAFDTMLEGAVARLETNSKNFESLNEVGLTGVLAASLSIPGLTVTQEAHSNGHVDLTIVADHCMPARRKLGEAKIYNGPAYHIAGLKQLLNRYMTGREGRGLVIEYVRKKNIAGLVKEIREKMDNDHPCHQQGETTEHKLKWSFLSTHTHSCGEDLEVSHIGCNLFVELALAPTGNTNG